MAGNRTDKKSAHRWLSASCAWAANRGLTACGAWPYP